MFKIDASDIFQLYMIIFCIITIFTYMVYTYKRKSYGIRFSNSSFTLVKAIIYTRKLWVMDYKSFEKYGIWRFCTLN